MENDIKSYKKLNCFLKNLDFPEDIAERKSYRKIKIKHLFIPIIIH